MDITDRATLNKEIVLCRPTVKKAKAFIVQKIVREVKNLENSKSPNEALRDKKKKKADRLLKEIELIKHLKADDVIKFALKTKNLTKYLNRDCSSQEHALAKLAESKQVQSKVNTIRNKVPNGQSLLFRLLDNLGKSKKKKPSQSDKSGLPQKKTLITSVHCTATSEWTVEETVNENKHKPKENPLRANIITSTPYITNKNKSYKKEKPSSNKKIQLEKNKPDNVQIVLENKKEEESSESEQESIEIEFMQKVQLEKKGKKLSQAQIVYKSSDSENEEDIKERESSKKSFQLEKSIKQNHTNIVTKNKNTDSDSEQEKEDIVEVEDSFFYNKKIKIPKSKLIIEKEEEEEDEETEFMKRPNYWKDLRNEKNPDSIFTDFQNKKFLHFPKKADGFSRRNGDYNGKRPASTPTEELHPSWAAAKKTKGITVFQGKKIKFNDD